MSVTPNRRTPQQSRSQMRVNLILDTASALFTELGYDATTTNSIADRAGISIGSLYQYFKNKASILNGLADRYRVQMIPIFDQIDTPDVIYLPPAVLIDRLLDSFLAIYDRYPVYSHLLLGSDVSRDIAHAFQGLEQEITGRLISILRRMVPTLDAQRAYLVALLCEAQLKALLSLLSTRKDALVREQIVAEVKRMLLAYLRMNLETGDKP